MDMVKIKKYATNRWAIAAAAAILVYTLVGFLLVPFLVRHYTPKITADRIKRQATIGKVRFNPFSLTFEVNDLALNEPDGQAIVGLKRIFLNFDPLSSLFRLSYVLGDLTLEGLSVNLVLDPDGKTNLSKIAESLPKSEAAPSSSSEKGLPSLLLKHFVLSEGSVRFTDLGKAVPVTDTLENLNLELVDLSTIPDKTGNYQIKAGLPDGGTVDWKGSVSLSPIASSGELKVEDFRVSTIWNFVKDRTNLAEPGGAIDISARYDSGYSNGEMHVTVSEAAFKLAGLQLALTDAEAPILSLEEMGFEGAGVDLAGRTVRIPSVFVRKGKIEASMDQKGALNWQSLLKPMPEGPAPAADPNTPVQSATAPAPTDPNTPAQTAPAPEKPWKVTVENLEIAEIGLTFVDAGHGKSPLVASVGDFGLTLQAQAEADSGAPKAHVDNLALHIDRVSLSQTGRNQRLFGWDSFVVEGGKIDLETQQVSLQKATVKGGGTAISRMPGDKIFPISLFATPGKPQGKRAPPVRRGPAAKQKDAPVAKPKAEPAGKPWGIRLGEFSLDGFGVELADRTVSPGVVYNLDNIQASVRNIGTDGATPVDFDASLKVRQGGSMKASGTASPKGDSAKAKVQVTWLTLRPVQPFLTKFTTLRLDSAFVSTDMSVDYRQAKPKPKVKASGGFRVHRLSLTETLEKKRFMAWKELSVNGINLSLAPDRLSVREIRIVEPYAVVAIYKDRTSNLTAVMKQEKPASPAPTPAAQPPAKAPPAVPAKKPFPASLGRIIVTNGAVDFSDISLVLPFATSIHDFNGSVAGFTTSPKDRAMLKFEGRVSPYGEAKVDGYLCPMDVPGYSDVKVVFTNIDMTSLSPYSATFAGRKIEAGKLNLDLQYKIENRLLDSKNEILLQDFTLGEKVDSPGATSLPLDLAIALLTDSEGKIQVAVPIKGSVDDPEFSYAKIIWAAVVTIIKNAVAAPFHAIASLFGGGEEEPGVVLFDPARDTIAPPEKEKLKKVTEALAQRPKLKMTIHGGFDPKVDGEALRSIAVRRALAAKMGVELAPEDEPDAVAFSNAAAQRGLEKLAAERRNPQAVAAVQAEYEKESGKRAQRIGALGGLMGRGSDTPEFYERLFRYLVDTAPLAQTELDSLAERRGKTVAAELVDVDKFDPLRLALGPIQETNAEKGDKVPTPLELGVE